MRSSTITLYIDTSSSFLYTGLVKGEELLIEVKESFEKDLSTHTLYRIQEMMGQVSVTPKEIDRIVVVNGPGSFTGIRIGVTIAKTFAWSLNKEIITISSLEAMAVSTITETLKVPYIDARRGYVYAGIYNKDNEVVLENQYISKEKLLLILEGCNTKYQWIGNDSLETEHLYYEPNILRIVEFSKNKKSVNPHSVNPEYLKRTEAEETKGMNAE